MGKIVAIDLGTTYCCVAIPEERNDAGFFVLEKCPGYSVVRDKFKRLTTPSVVAENSRGDIVVGYTAKNLTGGSIEPIMFAKRAMGEDVTFRLEKNGDLKPEEVSAHILRYLKTMAEERLGEPVDEAVVTIPAYFSTKAKQLTEKAGEMAGLKVAQIAQEPVAAALMYCAGDTRDPLQIMTYDLGGGTFDVAILEKKDGTISTSSVKAFDGDRFLGGYDFDKKLALWLVGRLMEIGYKLDANDPVTFAKLLLLAEKAKVKLSKEPCYEFSEDQTGIVDRDGNPVVIQLGICREEFERLIEPDIDYTIEICKRCMAEKADKPISPDQIDEIVMVGGSSQIPFVSRKLAAAFGKTPKMVNPDLCVALGAAILAGVQARTVGRLKLEPIPEVTDLPELDVVGKVLPEDGQTSLAGFVASLTSSDGSVALRQKTNENGGFAFEQVPLEPEATSFFALTVFSADGEKIAEHPFSVRHAEEAAGVGVDISTNMLAKPLSILLVDGPHEVAPVRTPLPYQTTIHAKTTDASGRICIKILEEHNPLGEILMTEVPKSLEVGSSVDIALEVRQNYQIVGKAYVPSLGREEKVVIDIPVPPKRSLEELKEEYARLDSLARDTKASVGKGALFGNAKVKRLDDRLAYCQAMLREQPPDTLKIQDCLYEIESLVRDIGAGWRPNPPKAEFDRKAEKADIKIAALAKQDPEIEKDGYDKQLEAIREQARKAYGEQNSAAWTQACERIDALLGTVNNLVREKGQGGGGSPPPQDPAGLLFQLGNGLLALERQAKEAGRYEELKQELEDARKSLEKIDPRAPDAMTKIRDWFFTVYESLRKKLDMAHSSETEGYVGIKRK